MPTIFFCRGTLGVTELDLCTPPWHLAAAPLFPWFPGYPAGGYPGAYPPPHPAPYPAPYGAPPRGAPGPGGGARQSESGTVSSKVRPYDIIGTMTCAVQCAGVAGLGRLACVVPKCRHSLTHPVRSEIGRLGPGPLPDHDAGWELHPPLPPHARTLPSLPPAGQAHLGG